MEWINHHSLLIAGLLVMLGAVYWLLRDGVKKRDLALLGSLLVIMVITWFIIRPRPTPASDSAVLQLQIGAGVPVLLQFQSPY